MTKILSNTASKCQPSTYFLLPESYKQSCNNATKSDLLTKLDRNIRELFSLSLDELQHYSPTNNIKNGKPAPLSGFQLANVLNHLPLNLFGTENVRKILQAVINSTRAKADNICDKEISGIARAAKKHFKTEVSGSTVSRVLNKNDVAKKLFAYKDIYVRVSKGVQKRGVQRTLNRDAYAFLLAGWHIMRDNSIGDTLKTPLITSLATTLFGLKPRAGKGRPPKIKCGVTGGGKCGAPKDFKELPNTKTQIKPVTQAREIFSGITSVLSEYTRRTLKRAKRAGSGGVKPPKRDVNTIGPVQNFVPEGFRGWDEPDNLAAMRAAGVVIRRKPAGELEREDVERAVPESQLGAAWYGLLSADPGSSPGSELMAAPIASSRVKSEKMYASMEKRSGTLQSV